MLVDESVIVQEVDAAAFTRLAAAFYRRMKTDDLIGPMYPVDDWAGAEDVLPASCGSVSTGTWATSKPVAIPGCAAAISPSPSEPPSATVGWKLCTQPSGKPEFLNSPQRTSSPSSPTSPISYATSLTVRKGGL